MKDIDSNVNCDVTNNIKIDDILTCEKENKFTNKKISLKKRLYKLRMKTGNFERQGIIPITAHNSLLNHEEIMDDNLFYNLQNSSKLLNKDKLNYYSNLNNSNNNYPYSNSNDQNPNTKRIVRLQKLIEERLNKLKQLINETNNSKISK